MNKIKIKDCPFCGGKAKRWGHYVNCKECGAASDTYSSPEKAIQAWNKRVGSNPTEGNKK